MHFARWILQCGCMHDACAHPVGWLFIVYLLQHCSMDNAVKSIQSAGCTIQREEMHAHKMQWDCDMAVLLCENAQCNMQNEEQPIHHAGCISPIVETHVNNAQWNRNIAVFIMHNA